MVHASAGSERGRPGRRARWVVLVVAVAALVFTAGSFVAPVLEGAGSGWGGVLRAVYAPLCHQSPERCMTVAGAPQAVCARCSGLYLGGVVGLFLGAFLVARPGRGPRPRWLAFAVAPTVVDALLPWIGLPQLPELPRLLLAVPPGVVAALFLAYGLTDLAARNGASSNLRGRELSAPLEDAHE